MIPEIETINNTIDEKITRLLVEAATANRRGTIDSKKQSESISDQVKSLVAARDYINKIH